MSQDLRKLLLHLALFAAPLVCLTFGPFLVFDPFKIIFHYIDPNPEMIDGHHVFVNVDYLATEAFLRTRQARHVRRFVFGSSRASVYHCEDWAKYVGDTPCFFFGASGETLYGIEAKIRLIDSLGEPLDRALVVLDADTLRGVGNSNGHLFMKHPALSGGSWVDFYATFVKAYFSDHFFREYLLLKLGGRFRPEMTGLFSDRDVRIDPVTFGWYFSKDEAEIERDPKRYYSSRASGFRPRSRVPLTNHPVIKAPQEALLESMATIFRRHGTNCEIVVSPLYDQVRLSDHDLSRLDGMFGEGHVHNYSGANDLTQPMTNYYESSHYRNAVARKILAGIYEQASVADGQAAR